MKIDLKDYLKEKSRNTCIYRIIGFMSYNGSKELSKAQFVKIQ